MLSHFLENELFELFVLNKLFQVGFSNSQTFSSSQNSIRIRMNYSNIEVLQWVTIKETLSNIRTSEVNVLNLLGGNVLSLTQLVNILLSVDDFQGAIGQNYSDISAVIPTVIVDSLFCVLLVQVVSFEDWVASCANLSSGRVVGRKVVHLWHIYQLELCCYVWATDVTVVCVTGVCDECCCCCLSLSVTFSYITI